LTNALRREIAAIDPRQPVASIATMDDVLDRSLRRPRFTVQLMAVFAALALTLAAAGIYAFLSYWSVRGPKRSAIRMALGADTKEILLLVLREGVPVTRPASGNRAGSDLRLCGLAPAAEPALRAQASDPLTYVGAGGFLAVVAMAACLAPATRAARVDPIVALRCE